MKFILTLIFSKYNWQSKMLPTLWVHHILTKIKSPQVQQSFFVLLRNYIQANIALFFPVFLYLNSIVFVIPDLLIRKAWKLSCLILSHHRSPLVTSSTRWHWAANHHFYRRWSLWSEHHFQYCKQRRKNHCQWEPYQIEVFRKFASLLLLHLCKVELLGTGFYLSSTVLKLVRLLDPDNQVWLSHTHH